MDISSLGITGVAVITVICFLVGQVVKATVVLAEGFEGSEVLVRELQQWVKQRTAPYKYPRVVEFVDAPPKTVNGKIRRAAIREADESQEGTPKTKVPEGLV